MGIFLYMCVLSCPMIHLELCGCNTIGFKIKNMSIMGLNVVFIGFLPHCAPHAGVVKHRSSALSKLILEMRHISSSLQ